MIVELKRLIEDNLVQGDDGYWLFWPEESAGAWSPLVLKEVLRTLDSLNSKVEDELESVIPHGDACKSDGGFSL